MERPIVHFVTGNSWRNEEAKRLLAGIDFRWARLNVSKPEGLSLAETARACSAATASTECSSRT